MLLSGKEFGYSVVAFASDEIVYIGKEISKQSIEGAAWLPLTNYKQNAEGDKNWRGTC